MVRLVLIIASMVVVLAVGVACGGGGGGTPTATPTEEGAEQEPTTGGGRTPAYPFERFHYVVNVDLAIAAPGEEESTLTGTVEGDYVAPDAHAFTTSFAFASLTFTQDVVIIGDQAWVREGDGAWEEQERALLDDDVIDMSAADPDFLVADEEFVRGITLAAGVPERVNAREMCEGGSPTGVERFALTGWVDEETQTPIRVEIRARATEECFGRSLGFGLPPGSVVTVVLRMNLTQIDDATIEIVPPV
jgi:hypothetical protein